MKNKKNIILIALIFLLGFTLISCNNKDEDVLTEVVEEETQKPEVDIKPDDKKEEAEELDIPKKIYEVGDIENIDEVISYFDKKAQAGLNKGITFDWTGRDDIENYKKRYYEEYIKLKTFYEKQYETYAYSENPEEIPAFVLRKAFLKDLDEDGIDEMILLIYHPVIEGEENTVLVYSYYADKDMADPIYKYTSGYYGMGDLGLYLDIGFVNVNGKDQLYIAEATETFYINETAIGYLDKILGEPRMEIHPAVIKGVNTDFELGNVKDSYFKTSNQFERYLDTITDPYVSLRDVEVKDFDEGSYMEVRNNIFGKDNVIFNSDRKSGEEYFNYELDENKNIEYENSDYLVLSEEELLKELLL
ncbi:MAG: hypothetical protein GX666_11390 [Tissierellia bacterium]|nr:hypothetical protein [Tissierellia bacterium]